MTRIAVAKDPIERLSLVPVISFPEVLDCFRLADTGCNLMGGRASRPPPRRGWNVGPAVNSSRRAADEAIAPRLTAREIRVLPRGTSEPNYEAVAPFRAS